MCVETSEEQSHLFNRHHIMYTYIIDTHTHTKNYISLKNKHVLYVLYKYHIILVSKPLNLTEMLSGSNGNHNNLNTLYTVDESSQNHLEEQHCTWAYLKRRYGSLK